MQCHIQRANFVVNCMVNCLDGEYRQPNPLDYGWQLNDGIIESIWYTGSALPNTEEIDPGFARKELGALESDVGEGREGHEPDAPTYIQQELFWYSELMSDSDDSEGQDCPSSEESNDEDD